MLVPCVRVFLSELLQQVEIGALPANEWLKFANQVLKLTTQNRARKIEAQYQINWAEILPLNAIVQSRDEKGQPVLRTAIAAWLQEIEGHFHLRPFHRTRPALGFQPLAAGAVLTIARTAAFSGSGSVAHAVTTRDKSGPKATEFCASLCVSACGFPLFSLRLCEVRIPLSPPLFTSISHAVVLAQNHLVPVKFKRAA